MTSTETTEPSSSTPADWTPAERKKYVTKIAFSEGLKSFAKTALISVPAVLLLTKYYPPFRKNMNVSARTALAISPPIFVFAFLTDRTTAKLANPDGFQTQLDEDTKLQADHNALLPYHKQMANYFYLNPFRTLVFTSIPVVAGIFLTRDTGSLKLSQRLMHTRVMGQASVLAILGTTMLFHEWMDRRGLFTA